MQYHYKDSVRLAFNVFNGSPTTTGLWFALCAVTWLCIGFAAWRRRFWIAWTVGGIGFLSSCVLLAFTYSRGAAAGVSIALIAVGLTVQNRRWLLCSTACVLLAFTSVANGVSRVATVFDVTTDRSISNRFVLWVGASRVIADNFPGSAGAYGLGYCFQKYWQPLDSDHWYPSAVNLWLTIYCATGPVGFFALCFIGFGACLIGYDGYRFGGDIAALWSLGLWVAFLSSNLFASELDPLLCSAILLSSGITLLRLCTKVGLPRSLVMRQLSVIAAGTCMLSLVPFVIDKVIPRPLTHGITMLHNSRCEWVEKEDAKRGLAVICRGSEDLQEDVRAGRLARAACDNGYKALIIPSTETPFPFEAVRVHAESHGLLQSAAIIYIAASRRATLHALRLAEESIRSRASVTAIGILDDGPDDTSLFLENVSERSSLPIVMEVSTASELSMSGIFVRRLSSICSHLIIEQYAGCAYARQLLRRLSTVQAPRTYF